jgi:hypothetical protein
VQVPQAIDPERPVLRFMVTPPLQVTFLRLDPTLLNPVLKRNNIAQPHLHRALNGVVEYCAKPIADTRVAMLSPSRVGRYSL